MLGYLPIVSIEGVINMYTVCPENSRLNWLMTSVFVIATIFGIPTLSLTDERPSQIQIQTASVDQNGFGLSYSKTFTVYVSVAL
jgi:hypothetical protein